VTRVHAFTISFPPRRFIGSELMTARLLGELRRAGHDVSVAVGDGNGDWNWEEIPVSGNALKDPPGADVLVVHAGCSWRGVEQRARTGAGLVMICHNTSPAVVDDLAGAQPDLVVVNSQTMADDLDVNALVVNPPAPPLHDPALGDLVTTLSLNKLKGGEQFWDLARKAPFLDFLAIEGGYGAQVRGDVDNVTVLKHVPHDRLGETVWARTGVFLQLAESESWGMAAAEAIAHGIPVIAHPTPGIVENLGDAAVYVDRDDIEGLSAALRRVLADPSPHSARAHARALEHQAASAEQLTAWVTAIEGLNDGAHNKRDRAAQGALVGHR
jgi:hypothetical protein